MKKYKQEDLKRTLGEPETAAYALSGQKKVRKAVRTEVDEVSRLEGIFRSGCMRGTRPEIHLCMKR